MRTKMASGSPPMAGTHSKPMGLFSDQDFLGPAKQVQNPDLNGWEFYVESMGVTIHRRYKEESGLYEYKVHGVMPDLDPEHSAMVYLDWEYRKKWDSYVLDLHPIKDEAEDLEGMYWAVDYPWPISDRDYTFIREGRMIEVDGQRTWVIVARSHNFASMPEKSNFIRVDDFYQSCAMQSDGKSGSRAFMHYYDNPKGMIPTWLINWAAKTGVPQFLGSMHDAVKGYMDFLKAEGKEWVLSEAEKHWGHQQQQ